MREVDLRTFLTLYLMLAVRMNLFPSIEDTSAAEEERLVSSCISSV